MKFSFSNLRKLIIIWSKSFVEQQGSVCVNYEFLADSHVHTAGSLDGSGTAAEKCAEAVRKNISDLTVTDHCDCNIYYADNIRKLVLLSLQDTMAAQNAFRGRLRVHTGVELGQPLQNLSAAEEAIGIGRFDFVLASVHNLRGKPDFYHYDAEFAAPRLAEILSRYFSEILETIEWGRFDSLAHLTYPWRYLQGREHLWLPEEDWREEIDRVLLAIIRKGKALEVNTSGFRQELGVSMPDLPIVKRYHELGGTLVTIGSDAHRTEDVGADLGRGLDLLKQAGFSSFAVYEAHQPKLYPIESTDI